MKKLFCILLMVLLVFSCSFIINAEDNAVDNLVALNILKGDKNGDLMLDKNVSRYQAALLFAQTISGETKTEIWDTQKTSINFKDVKSYGTAIDYTHGMKIIAGRGNGIFGPDDPITYQDMLVMAVRALGYESEATGYPYGYILVAQKLGLTKNLSIADYKKALTRAETAQIIWDMLNTEISVNDPLTNKILYPGEMGLTDSITGKPIVRKTLIEQSGFVSDSFDFVIKKVSTIDDELYLTLDNGLEVKASDFNIDEDTPKISYLGLGGKAYINCALKDFEEGSTVIVRFNTYQSFTNFDKEADLTNNKYKNYTINYYTFDKNGWTVTNKPNTIVGNYQYRIDEDNKIIDILYTPISFGQYVERELRYSPTNKKETFVLIGTFINRQITAIDKTKTYFEEATVDGKIIVESMSKSNGEKSKTVKVIGTIENGNCMYYYYNAIDNILTIYEDCGAINAGKVTSVGKNNVKINSVSREVDTSFNMIYTNLTDLLGGYAQYVVYEGKIIFLQKYDAKTSAIKNAQLGIISNQKEIMEKVYGKDLTLTDGLYIVDGKVAVARLSLETGKWEKYYFTTVALNYKDDEYKNFVNIADLAKFADMIALSESKKEVYAKAKAVLNSAIITIVDDNTIANSEQIECGQGTKLTFNSAGRTNAITDIPDGEPTRITTNKDTIIVAVNGTDVRVRKGIQSTKQSITRVDKIYSASEDLIIVTTSVDLSSWENSGVSSSEAYYITTIETEVDIEPIEDKNYKFIVNKIFDLTNNRYTNLILEAKSITFINNFDKVGTVLFRNDTDKLTVFNGSIYEAIAKEDYFEPITIDFIDNETISVDNIINTDTAVTINATVVTINLSDEDFAEDRDYYVKDIDYDYTKYSPAVPELDGRYAYSIDFETKMIIDEPTLGVYSNFEKDMSGKTIVYKDENGKEINAFKVDIYTLAKYDKDTDTVELYILKLIKNP